MATDESIGSLLRELRVKNGFTLKQVSAKTGMSTGILSQIERGISTLEVKGLDALAKLYGVDASLFFHTNDSSSPVVRGYERIQLQVSDNSIGYTLMRNSNNQRVIPYMYELYPDRGIDEEEAPFVHESEEFVHVIEGRLTYTVNGVNHMLNPGDTIFIPSGIPHYCRNDTERTVKVLVIINYEPAAGSESEDSRQ